MHDEHSLTLGRAARAVQENDLIMGLIQSLQAKWVTALLSTETHEVKTRDALYLKVNAMRSVVAEIEALVAEADTIIAAREAQREEERADAHMKETEALYVAHRN